MYVQDGRTETEIAALLSISRARVAAVLREAGIPRRTSRTLTPTAARWLLAIDEIEPIAQLTELPVLGVTAARRTEPASHDRSLCCSSADGHQHCQARPRNWRQSSIDDPVRVHHDRADDRFPTNQRCSCPTAVLVRSSRPASLRRHPTWSTGPMSGRLPSLALRAHGTCPGKRSSPPSGP